MLIVYKSDITLKMCNYLTIIPVPITIYVNQSYLIEIYTLVYLYKRILCVFLHIREQCRKGISALHLFAFDYNSRV